MGASISHAEANVTTPLPPPLGPVPEKGVAGPPVGLQQLVEPPKETERTDYLNLPTPVKYEEIQKEALCEYLGSLLLHCPSTIWQSDAQKNWLLEAPVQAFFP